MIQLTATQLFWGQQPPKPRPSAQNGIAYLAVLFLVAAITITMAVVSQDVDLRLKREKEQDWFFVGNQYKQAVASYYHQSPDGLKALPKNIDDLLLDRRFIAPVRHLRKAYHDPLTNQPWMLVKSLDDSLVGVRSLKQQTFISTRLLQQLQAEQGELDMKQVKSGSEAFGAEIVNVDEPKEPLQDSATITQYDQVWYVFQPKQEAAESPPEANVE